MASIDKTPPESGKPVSPPPRSEAPPPSAGLAQLFSLDVILRIILFVLTLVALVVMVTGKQTKLLSVPGVPVKLSFTAKFDHSPAFVYFVVAMSIACLYSILTILASFSVIVKPIYAGLFLLLFPLMDVVILGLVASATGTAGGVAYIGLRGNSHVNWDKICPDFEKFCQHVGSSIAISLLASILLVCLVMLSIYSLFRRMRR